MNIYLKVLDRAGAVTTTDTHLQQRQRQNCAEKKTNEKTATTQPNGKINEMAMEYCIYIWNEGNGECYVEPRKDGNQMYNFFFRFGRIMKTDA